MCYGAIRDWDDTATTPAMFGETAGFCFVDSAPPLDRAAR